ncbi:DUF2993 domain-containing protein [Streptomyces sp. NPDC001404]|uniref:LmeA family phospholipid-binding protein n=1 Tax=Streptomyces sp. NPDC001404 TaxID=3364571 RepID=UPI003697E93F
MPPRPSNPYDELASLADPEPVTEPITEPIPIAVPEPVPISLGDPGDLGERDDEPWSPPDHRRARRPGPHRRRHRPRRKPRHRHRLLKLLIAAGALAVILLLADRCAAMYAEKKAEQKLQQALHLEAAPQVDIRGFPFLTQVLDKRLTRVDVTVPHLAADRVSIARVHASAQDIRLTGSLPNDVRGAVVGQMEGNVLLSFDDMNRELAASQVKFSDGGGNVIAARGSLNVAGQELVLRAQAHLRRAGDQGVSTDIDGMSLDLPGIAVYRPGGGDKSLLLHRETAERISRDAARVKALFSVPSIAQRLGLSPDDAAAVLDDEERLHEVTGAPRFVDRLMQVNLIDVVVDHPWLLGKVGIDPKVLDGVTQLRPPELSDRLSFSFRLPKEAEDLHLHLDKLTVQRDGVRADVSGSGLSVSQ